MTSPLDPTNARSNNVGTPIYSNAAYQDVAYVDWDGLVYYDSKVKEYIRQTSLPFGGILKFDQLPDPSYDNLNHLYQISEEFVSDNRFKDPGYRYSENTWIRVTSFDDVYLYTIFVEQLSIEGNITSAINRINDQVEYLLENDAKQEENISNISNQLVLTNNEIRNINTLATSAHAAAVDAKEIADSFESRVWTNEQGIKSLNTFRDNIAEDITSINNSINSINNVFGEITELNSSQTAQLTNHENRLVAAEGLLGQVAEDDFTHPLHASTVVDEIKRLEDVKITHAQMKAYVGPYVDGQIDNSLEHVIETLENSEYVVSKDTFNATVTDLQQHIDTKLNTEYYEQNQDLRDSQHQTNLESLETRLTEKITTGDLALDTKLNTINDNLLANLNARASEEAFQLHIADNAREFNNIAAKFDETKNYVDTEVAKVVENHNASIDEINVKLQEASDNLLAESAQRAAEDARITDEIYALAENKVNLVDFNDTVASIRTAIDDAKAEAINDAEVKANRFTTTSLEAFKNNELEKEVETQIAKKLTDEGIKLDTFVDKDWAKQYVSDNAMLRDHEVVAEPGMIVDYRADEVRVNAQHIEFKQPEPGTTSDPSRNDSKHYIAFKSYAPANAYMYKYNNIEGDYKFFENNEFAGTDQYGRKYFISWLPVATYDSATEKWAYSGDKSTTEKFSGWNIKVFWYDKDAKLISVNPVRVNLTNDTCHDYRYSGELIKYVSDVKTDIINQQSQDKQDVLDVVNSVDAKVDEVNTSITNILGTITNIGDQVNRIDSKVDEQSKAVAKNAEDISATKTQIIDVQNQLADNLHTNAEELKNAIDGVEGRIAQTYVTKTELDSKGYLTEHQSLENYATKDFVNESFSKLAQNYYTKDETEDAIAEAIKDIDISAAGVTNEQLAAEVARAQAAEQELQDKIDLIIDNPDTENAINSLKEFSKYVEDHATIAEGFRKDIDEVSGKVSELEKDNSEFALKSEVPTKVSDLTNDEGYITADDIPEAELYKVDFNTPNFAEALKAYNSGKILVLINAAPDVNSYAVMNYVSDKYITFTKFLISRSEAYGAFNTYYLSVDNTWEVAKEVKLNKVEANIEGEIADKLSTVRIGKEIFSIPETDLSNYYNKTEVDGIIKGIEIPTVPTKVSDLTNDAGYVTEKSLNHLATKDELNAFENHIGYVATDEKSFAEAIDERFATKSELDDAVKNVTVDLTGYATEEFVSSAVAEKANNVLFTEDYYVTNPVGGFEKDTSLKDMTIRDILITLLALKQIKKYSLKFFVDGEFYDEKFIEEATTIQFPEIDPVKEGYIFDGWKVNGIFLTSTSIMPAADIEAHAAFIEKPAEPETIVEKIMDSKTPMYQVNENGEVIEIPYVYEDFTEAEAAAAPTKDCFYQIKDESGNVIESGYQHVSEENDSMYYLVLLPKELDFNTNVTVQYWDNGAAKSWMPATVKMSNDLALIEGALAEGEMELPIYDSDKYTLWIDSSLETCAGTDYRFIINE